MTHDELIAALEKATGPGRILDFQIHRAILGKPILENDVWWVHRDVIRWKDGTEDAVTDWPRYTASIDAALTLVPEGWWAQINYRPDQPSVVLWEFPVPCRRVPPEKPYVLAAQSAAIALCIAAMKARA